MDQHYYMKGMRMPLILYCPKTIKPGTVCDTLINNTDFAPTLLDYAGIETPASMQGCSFRSIAERDHAVYKKLRLVIDDLSPRRDDGLLWGKHNS